MKYLKLIESYYCGKTAKRSGVPYINHIYEGLSILKHYSVGEEVLDAYALHPMFQEDNTLLINMSVYSIAIDSFTMSLVMEYRNVANRGLHCYQVDDPSKIYLSPISDVNLMLVADKVQNRKDFMTYHFGTHPKSKELDIYFKNWLRALKVTEKEYEKLCEIIENEKR